MRKEIGWYGIGENDYLITFDEFGNINPLISKTNFDSYEEYEFFIWTINALAKGLIIGYVKYHPESIEVIPKAVREYEVVLKSGKRKKKIKTILQPLTYTPDFIFSTTLEFGEYLINNLKWIPYEVSEVTMRFMIDVKGAFSKYNDSKYFSALRKIMFKEKGIYICKAVPKDVFAKTWCPSELRFHKRNKGKERKSCAGLLSMKEFLAENFNA